MLNLVGLLFLLSVLSFFTDWYWCAAQVLLSCLERCLKTISSSRSDNYFMISLRCTKCWLEFLYFFEQLSLLITALMWPMTKLRNMKIQGKVYISVTITWISFSYHQDSHWEYKPGYVYDMLITQSKCHWLLTCLHLSFHTSNNFLHRPGYKNDTKLENTTFDNNSAFKKNITFFCCRGHYQPMTYI